jgi:hypothetical protein
MARLTGSEGQANQGNENNFPTRVAKVDQFLSQFLFQFDLDVRLLLDNGFIGLFLDGLDRALQRAGKGFGLGLFAEDFDQ